MIPGAAGREHAELGPWGGRRLRALPSPQPESGGAAGWGGGQGHGAGGWAALGKRQQSWASGESKGLG